MLFSLSLSLSLFLSTIRLVYSLLG